jgi:transcriptional regulator with XRE-family HTH domain
VRWELAGSRQSLRLVPPESFASRLRRQRHVDDLTQAELGERFGVRQQTIGAWERGERPQSRFLGPLAEYLRLTGEPELVALLDGQQTESLVEQDANVSMADEPVETDGAAVRLLLRRFVKDQESRSLPPKEAAEIYKDLIAYFQARADDQ